MISIRENDRQKITSTRHFRVDPTYSELCNLRKICKKNILLDLIVVLKTICFLNSPYIKLILCLHCALYSSECISFGENAIFVHSAPSSTTFLSTRHAHMDDRARIYSDQVYPPESQRIHWSVLVMKF